MKLTKEQQLVAYSQYHHTVAVAPAGAGKTATSIEFIRYQGNAAIVAFTLTNKAANEIKERLNGECPNVGVSTIHKFAYNLIKSHSNVNYIMLTDSAQLALIQRGLGGDKKLQQAINKFKCKGITPEQSGEPKYSQYEYLCKKGSYLDFSSMAAIATPLVQCFNKIDVLCVDEAQDLSQDQMNLIDAIVKHHNPKVLLVGDPRQAIYGWRGGMDSPFNYFISKYTDSKLLNLTYNFRSSEAICDAGNKVTHLKHLPDVKAGLKIKGFVEKNTYPTADIERMQVVSRIRELRSTGNNGNAILFRTNHQMSRYEYPLIRACIPYEIWGGRKLLDHNEIKCILAWLSLLDNNQNNAALFVAAQSITGIGKVAAKNLTIESAQQETKKQPIINFFDCYVLFLNEYNSNQSIRFAIDLIAEIMGIKEPKLNKAGLVTDKEVKSTINRSTRVDVLADLSEGHNSISGFIEKISMDTDSSEKGDVNKVILSTVHKAKGLEFNNVFVPNLIEGNMPMSDNKGNISDIGEETNIAYVAFTRPRFNLFESTHQEGDTSRFF